MYTGRTGCSACGHKTTDNVSCGMPGMAGMAGMQYKCDNYKVGAVVAPDCQSRGRWFNHTYLHVSKLRQFRSPHICLCLSEETLKAGGPFYLVYMPREVKDPTEGVNV